jgi:23S rRNA-intervening sequence protein
VSAWSRVSIGPQAISYQLSAISYQLSAISYQLSAISYQLSAISYQLSAISYQRPEGIGVRYSRNFWVIPALNGLPRKRLDSQIPAMGDYRKLKVWKKARLLVAQAYRLTQALPAEERYGLKAQIRSASVSVMANIAEGCGRNRDRELHDSSHFRSAPPRSLNLK